MEVLFKIKNCLKKKKEDIIFDLYLENYDKNDFYFALVFNRKIEKFKILYVPIKAIGDGEDVGEYFCYQFIFVNSVHYMLQCIKEFESTNKALNKDCRIKGMDAYLVEVNTYVAGEENKYLFTRYIDPKFTFFFDVIVTIFEHSPNIVNELGMKLLKAFNSNEIIPFNGSFDIEGRSFSDLFDKEYIYKKDSIDYLEVIGNKYYGIVNNKLIIVEYLEGLKILNIYSGKCDILGEEVYNVLEAILDKYEKDFYHLKFIDDNNREVYYLCYGIEDDYFKIVDFKNNHKLSMKYISKERIKISNCDSNLVKKIKNYLSKTYEDFKVDELVNYICEEEN